MSCGCGCISVKTPASILADDPTADVFKTLLGGDSDDANHPYRSEEYAALWARFRYRGIGNCDLTYWQQCLADRFAEIKQKYEAKFKIYAGFLSSSFTDLAQSSGTVTYLHEDMPDTSTSSTFLSTRDTTTVKNYEGLPSTTARQAIDDVPDPYTEFAAEFDRLFVGRMY